MCRPQAYVKIMELLQTVQGQIFLMFRKYLLVHFLKENHILSHQHSMKQLWWTQELQYLKDKHISITGTQEHWQLHDTPATFRTTTKARKECFSKNLMIILARTKAKQLTLKTTWTSQRLQRNIYGTKGENVKMSWQTPNQM